MQGMRIKSHKNASFTGRQNNFVSNRSGIGAHQSFWEQFRPATPVKESSTRSNVAKKVISTKAKSVGATVISLDAKRKARKKALKKR